MNRLVIIPVIAIAMMAGLHYGRSSVNAASPDQPATLQAPVGATLLKGLCNYNLPVTSNHPDVQRWFNQALMLTYGFNHAAAERS